MSSDWTNGWTLRSLYEHFTHVIATQRDAVLRYMDERDRRYEARWVAQEEAIIKAEIAQDKRLDAMNEFRQALADAQRTYLTVTNYNIRHDELTRRIEAQDERITALDRWRGQLDALRGSREEGVTQKLLPTISIIVSLLVGVGVVLVATLH